MLRRQFIQRLSGTALLLTGGNVLTAGIFADKKVLFRFAVASDGHFGQKNTEYTGFYQSIVQSINAYHLSNPLDACVINGDIIHDNPDFLPAAATTLKELKVPFYVTRGNHDRVTASAWENAWGMPLNDVREIKDQVFILGDTSNEAGKYLPPDTDFFSDTLKHYKKAKNIFIFTHITPVQWTDNGVNASDFQKLIRPHKNIRAVFNGHDHDQDNVKMLGHIPFLFDGHFGGSWGTSYRGFRIVELLEDNSIRSFIMNPADRINYFDSIS